MTISRKEWLEQIDLIGGIKTAGFVGIILTIINQWDALTGPQEFSFVAFVLTFLVPFCVYQYGRIKNR